MINPRWYVIILKDRQVALKELGRMGFEFYAPEVREVNGLRPMFGRYIFVRLDLEVGGWRQIWNTRGVRGLLCMNPESPSVLPRGFVEELMEVGIVDRTVISVGDNVVFKDGPFAGHAGTCLATKGKRLEILFHLLGRENKVYCEASSVTPVNLR